MANPRNVFRNLKIKILEIASAISVSTAVMLAVFIFLSAQVTQAATNAGITYQGRILKPDGTPLQGASVQFRLQLRTPNTSSCLMYEETQLQDMRNSNGIFSLTMNDGTGTRSDSTALGLDRIFANRGSFTFDPATCQSGSSYTPNEDDGRTLVVYFKDETMSVWEPMPPQALNFVPLAIEAKQIAGFGAKNLLRFAESDGTLVNTSPLNNAQYLELVALVSGNSNVYEKAGKLAGGTLPTLAAGQVLGWSGTAWTAVDPSSSSASVLKDPDGGANTVTFQVDPAIAANYTVTWPATVGAANQVLVNDGTGKLSWGAPPAATQWTTTGSDIYYSTGNVGIGLNAPTAKLETKRTDTSTAAGSIVGLQSNVDAVPTTSSAADYWAVKSTAAYNGTQPATGALRGGEFTATTGSAANTNGAYGVVGQAGNNGGGTTANAIGVFGYGANYGSGTITNARGGYFVVNNTGTGTISNGYGVYIGPITATNKFSLYSSDASAPAYFAGNVGIGATVPGAHLDVNTTSISTTGTVLGTKEKLTAMPTAASAANFVADIGTAETAAGNTQDYSGFLYSLSGQTSHRGTGIVAEMAGADGEVYNKSTGTITNAFGVQGGVVNQAGGDVTNASAGLFAVVNQAGGMIGTANGVRIQPPGVLGAGHITNYRALYIENPTAADTNYSIYSEGGLNYLAGNVGIGTNAPTDSLHVVGAANGSGGGHVIVQNTTDGGVATAAFQAKNSANVMTEIGTAAGAWSSLTAIPAGSGFIKTSSSNGLSVITEHVSGSVRFYTGGSASSNERMRLSATGNVGIGTTSPVTALDVAGAIRVGDTAATCASTNAGAIRYNTGAVQYCNGTAWVAMDSDSFAAVSCTNGQAIFRGPSGWICKTGSSTTAADTVVIRDASQNFAANTATLNTLSLNNAGSVVNINNPLGAAYNLTLPANAGTNGYVLTTNGSGVLSWTDPGTSGQWSVSGSDVYRSSGRVGIGTSAPSSRFNVADNPYFETGNYDTSFIRSVANSNTVSNGHIITQRVNMLVGDSRQTHLTSASHNDLQLLSSGTTVRGMTQSNFASVNGSGAVQNVTSNSNEIAIASGSTVTDAMGIYSKIANAGATTNGYGVYIDTIGGTNHWGLYQVGATEKNYFAGQVGIGTSAPAAYLDIQPPDIVNPSATVRGISSTILTNNTSTGSQSVYGAWMQSSAIQNSSPNGSLTGSVSFVQNGATGTTADVIGADNQAYHTWTGTTTNLIGTRSEATLAWNGPVTNITGIYGHAYRIQGTATTMYGGNFLADQMSGSTITNAYGIKSEAKSYSGSTITNGYGVYAAVTPNSGTITNRYGVYIADAGTGTNYYNLYSAGTGKNYFSGNVGVGTTAPGGTLEAVATFDRALLATVTRDSDTTEVVAEFNRSKSGSAAPTANMNGQIEFNLEGFTNGSKAAAASMRWGWENIQTNNTTDRDGYLDFMTAEDNGRSTRLRITSSGNVGIGAAPTTKLQVAGVISPSADNTHDLGTSALRFKDIYAANNVIQTSDARLKTDVTDSDLGLKFVNSLRPVSYYWKEGDSKLHYGVIAQETEKALSEAKKQAGRSQEVDNVIVTHDEKTDRYGVRYTELIAPIIKAVQELYNGFINHDSRLTGLEKQNTLVQRSIASVSAQQESANAKTVKLELENQKLKLENAAQAKQLEALKSWVCAKDPAAAICK